MKTTEIKELFDRWYKRPLQLLESLENGDGGFVVLATCCFLYERYATAVIKERNQKADDDAKRQQFACDFSTTIECAEAYKNVIRNGFLHQGMGLQASQKSNSFPSWAVSSKFPIIELHPGPPMQLRMNPWLFRDTVMCLWDARPDLVGVNVSFPWATIQTTARTTESP